MIMANHCTLVRCYCIIQLSLSLRISFIEQVDYELGLEGRVWFRMMAWGLKGMTSKLEKVRGKGEKNQQKL